MRRARWAVLSAVVVVLAGCGGTAGESRVTTSDAPTSPSSSAAFDPARTTTLYSPVGAKPGDTRPVVVLVPGGGWQSHDSTGLIPLAQGLSDAGYVVATTEYRAGNEGYGFPVSVQDVMCSAAYVVAQTGQTDVKPGPVILVGHSAGGHLVALAGVSGTALQRPCDDPVPAIAGVVGLAGVYETRDFAQYLTDWFGASPADEPALWDSGDPIHYVVNGEAPPELKVLLVHGDADDVVPLSQSQAFTDALTSANIDVFLEALQGETHDSVITVGVLADDLLDWLRPWAPAA